jgi:hypothetical protein
VVVVVDAGMEATADAVVGREATATEAEMADAAVAPAEAARTACSLPSFTSVKSSGNNA